jgi:hypothetical protein
VITGSSTGARLHPSAQGRGHVTLDGSMERVLANGGKNGGYFSVGSHSSLRYAPQRVAGLRVLVSFTARNPTRRTPLRHQSKQSTDRAVVLLGPPRLVAGLFRAREVKAHRRKEIRRRSPETSRTPFTVQTTK